MRIDPSIEGVREEDIDEWMGEPSDEEHLYLDTLDSVELLENLENSNDEAYVGMFYHFEEIPKQ